mgnify:CR=1 FL=1
MHILRSCILQMCKVSSKSVHWGKVALKTYGQTDGWTAGRQSGFLYNPLKRCFIGYIKIAIPSKALLMQRCILITHFEKNSYYSTEPFLWPLEFHLSSKLLFSIYLVLAIKTNWLLRLHFSPEGGLISGVFTDLFWVTWILVGW